MAFYLLYVGQQAFSIPISFFHFAFLPFPFLQLSLFFYFVLIFPYMKARPRVLLSFKTTDEKQNMVRRLRAVKEAERAKR